MRTQSRPATERGPGSRSGADLPSVLAIVVTHDGREWLRECLTALNTQSYPMLDVLVVDDASPDRGRPTLKRIAKRHLRQRRWGYLRTRRPLGFGGAINWALSRVRTDADLLMFIHDDAALDRTSVEHMVARILADDETAIVGPKVVSWDDPSRLEEVGMAVDRFGYPYKGLEEGEIDLGQHDVPSEVFYVTSTCMLIRHEVFRDLQGWDARMRAFAEDLDLCWRARIAGHAVRVEPRAKARHAIALATGLRDSPFWPPRYFIRRNRLRTVVKNASGLRLLALLPLFVLLSLAEMIAFVLLRQPREVWNLARGLGWNLVTFPQALSERARVQRRRKVPDRNLRRLMVRVTSRLRAYVEHQAERIEEAWGRRTELVARRGQQARALGNRLRGPLGASLAGGAVALAIAFRNVIWSPPVAVGDVLPFPEGATALWRNFLSPWQGAGLGDDGPASPALLVSGMFSILGFGDAANAQKLMLVTLALLAFVGAYSVVSEVVDRTARFVGAGVYVFGNVGYAAIQEGALGALFFAAAAPFVFRSLLRLVGWMRPPGWNRGRAIARVALGAAVSAAFVPGSLFLYLGVMVVLVALRVLDRPRNIPAVLISCSLGIAAGWALLLPWSASWWAPGGPLARLTGTTAPIYAATYEGHGALSVILGQTPEAPALFGLALPLLGLLAVLIGEGQRRRVALALWGIVGLTGLLASLTAGGFIDPLVATPTELGVVSAAAYAGLAALAVGAFRLDLPRRGLGWMHALSLSALSGATFLVLAGLAPAVLAGAWDPGRGTPAADEDTLTQIETLTASEAAQAGEYRTLWVGRHWLSPVPSAARPARDYGITGSRGPRLEDLFERDGGAGDVELQGVVSSIDRGLTDRGGRLLGGFNIRYIVVDPGERSANWLAQRDLALVRQEPTYLLLENRVPLPRLASYGEVPGAVAALGEADPALARAGAEPAAVGHQVGRAEWLLPDDAPSGATVFFAERGSEGWNATQGGEPLEPVPVGWGNAFAASSASGPIEVAYERPGGLLLGALVLAMAWLVVLGGAFSRSRRVTVGRRRRT